MTRALGVVVSKKIKQIRSSKMLRRHEKWSTQSTGIECERHQAALYHKVLRVRKRCSPTTALALGSLLSCPFPIGSTALIELF